MPLRPSRLRTVCAAGLRRTAGLAAAALAASLLGACEEPASLVPDEAEATDIAVGERRFVELRYTRFDVDGFVKENTLEDLRRMPRRVLEDIWLLDLDITPLTTNALEQLRGLDPAEVAAQPQAVQNMRTLLSLTPDNAILEGTNLEELSELSSVVGIPTARAFGNLLEVGVTDDFVPPDIVAEAITDNVIGSHPNAQMRRGPVDAEHPEGLYPVAPRSIPLTMADVVTNFEDLSNRFGASGDHPGFVAAAKGVTVIEEDFLMRSQVTVNALPFKGIDLGLGEVASVSSVGSQIETLHDFSKDNWLELEGLIPEPAIEELTIRVQENSGFIAGGTSREPVGIGNGSVWDLPVWEFEFLIADMARRTAERISAHCDAYDLATGATAFTACIDEEGWVSMETFNDIGSPPDPSYLWDIELELGQVRLHDGGLEEGEGNVEFTVYDVGVGVTPDEMIAQLRKNVQANPEALREFAALLIDNASGNADLYYYRSDEGDDWLYFVLPEDIQLDDEGESVRPYDYTSAGFFDDAGLTREVSTLESIDGDDVHAKLKIRPGDVFYVGDDDGAVFEVSVLEKPSRARVGLEIKRMD